MRYAGYAAGRLPADVVRRVSSENARRLFKLDE
jgi:hypothetical protein